MSSLPQDLGHPLIHEDFLPTPKSTTHLTLCATCHTPAPGRHCRACKSIPYCSTTCQTKDWPQHKQLCKSLQKSLTQRPSPHHRRALFFPAESTPAQDSSAISNNNHEKHTTAKPKCIYLASYNNNNDPIPINIFPFLNHIPPTDIETLAFHNRNLPSWTQISYDANPHSERVLQVNKSIGGNGAVFRGPVVVRSFDAVAGLSGPALDVDGRVLGAVREYVRIREGCGGIVFVEQPQAKYTEEEWGEIVRAAREKYSDGDWAVLMGTAGLGH